MRGLRASEVDTAARMLGRAFFGDPGATFVEPDPARRAAANGAVFAAVLRFALVAGDVVTTPELDAVAVWLPPERPSPTEADLIAAGFEHAVEIMGPQASARMATMNAHFETIQALAIAEPHWHLALIGVEPERQGRGLGSALIAPGHARADSRGQRCYLETFTESDVAFYSRRGYDVKAEAPLPGTDVPVRGMVR